MSSRGFGWVGGWVGGWVLTSSRTMIRSWLRGSNSEAHRRIESCFWGKVGGLVGGWVGYGWVEEIKAV